MSRLFCIVQARRASTRLPDKALAPLAGQPMLRWVLDRCRRVPGLSALCCALPDGAQEAPLVDVAEAAGAVVAHGPEDDVLRRYRLAADGLGATDDDAILRVTSDCPLIDPQVCGAVADLFRATGADYVSNNRRPEWPHGLDCEVFSVRALRTADAVATAPHEREHVTYWMTDSGACSIAHLECPLPGVARHRWTVDTPTDHAFIEDLLRALPEPAMAGWRDVLAVLDQAPDLLRRSLHDR